jgi:hypothetical protein
MPARVSVGPGWLQHRTRGGPDALHLTGTRTQADLVVLLGRQLQRFCRSVPRVVQGLTMADRVSHAFLACCKVAL